MKRNLSILVILCLIVTMLAACANVQTQPVESDVKTPPVEANTQTPTVEANVKTPPAPPAPPTKLVIAARGGSHVQVLEAVKADFEAANNVTIEVLGLEAPDLKKKISLDSQNRIGAYDLAMADDPWMPEFVEAGIFENLTELGYEPDPDFVKASIDIARHPYGQGDLFALPFAGNVQLLFYNKEVINSAGLSLPESWADVLNIAKTIHEKGKIGYVIRGQQGNPIVGDFLPILWAHGGDLFDDNWNVTVNTPQAREALNLYIQLLANGANFERNDIVASVSGGNAAMSLGWPSWYISGENASAGYASIPARARTNSPEFATGMIGNWMMGVTANSANTELALKFLEYVTSAEVQKKAAEFGGVPTRTSVFTDSELAAKFPHFATILASTQNSVVRPRTPLWSDIEAAFGIELSNAISGTKSVDEALADAQVAIESIMK
jgi:multiple sugar transport system substrate-binding protein